MNRVFSLLASSSARVWLVALFLAASPVRAVTPDELLGDPAMEARARLISQQLRCVVCQNQSIDDSAAPLARDLRLLVRERLQRGDTDRQAIDFIVARYGNYVLLQPPLQLNTLVLWFGPLLLLFISSTCFGLYLHRHRRTTERTAQDPQLSVDEFMHLEEQLEKGPLR